MKNIKKLLGIGIMSIVLSTSVFAAGKLPKEAADKDINIYINDSIQNISKFSNLYKNSYKLR